MPAKVSEAFSSGFVVGVLKQLPLVRNIVGVIKKKSCRYSSYQMEAREFL